MDNTRKSINGTSSTLRQPICIILMYRNAAKLFYLHVEPVFIFNKVEKGISVMVGVVFKLGGNRFCDVLRNI